MTKDLRTLPWLTKICIPAEIQDLWIRARKKIGSLSSSEFLFIFHRSDEAYYDQGGPPPPIPNDLLAQGKDKVIYYKLDGEWRTESDMLRLLKLKAFL